MAATPQVMNFRGRRVLTLKYDSNCHTCGTKLYQGDEGFYAPNADSVSGVECCGDRDDTELLGLLPESTPDVESTVPLAQVMPRGKTAKDRCDQCFMVHSPGQQGCDW